MPFWPIDRCAARRDEGFATPAAAVISLGLALAASAITSLSIVELTAAQADAARANAEFLLDGYQDQAGLTVLMTPISKRLGWSISSPHGAGQILAEPEGVKLGLAAALSLDHMGLDRLGVEDPEQLQGRLQMLSRDQALGRPLDEADASPIWRDCARSVISPFGAAKALPKLTYDSPAPGGAASHAGEVWRLRVTADGWADDRIVRFTGDPLHPAAVIEREMYRRRERGDECASRLAVR